MSEWFKTWFGSDEYLNVYQHRNNEDAGKLIQLIISETKLLKGSSVLDAACGAGRHAFNLQYAGYHVTGFDLSKTLLKIAMRNAGAQNLSRNFFCADLRNVYLKKQFDLVVNLFTSFGYFENDVENFLFPKSAIQFLKNEGYYILDFLNAFYVIKNLIPESVKEFDSKTIIENRKISNGRVEKEIIIENKNGTETFMESVRLYTKHEIVRGFENLGYRTEKIFGDYSGSVYDENDSERLIIFFKK